MNLLTYEYQHLFRSDQDEVLYKSQNNFSQITYNQGRHSGQLDLSKNVPLIRFPALSNFDFINHGFSTRLGGVSEGEYGTMNLSFERGDNKENVIENYNRICNSLGLEPSDLIFSDQVHNTKIHVVTEADKSRSPYEKRLEGMDGLITNVPNLTLVTSYADCVPLFFVDPVHKAIGLSHSGWKGTAHKIGLKTVKAMQEQFGSNPGELITVIGPSICNECYEISEDVAKAFMNNFSPQETNHFLYKKNNEKYQLDLWLANKYIMLEAGIKEEHISISNLCTCCNSSLFFSHRASNGKRGNLAAFLTLL